MNCPQFRTTPKAKQVVLAALDEIAPECPEMLLSALRADYQGDETVDNSLQFNSLSSVIITQFIGAQEGRSCP